MAVMFAGQKALAKATGGRIGAYPSFGMSMRFSVQVTDLKSPPGLPGNTANLGLWQSCRNLEMEMQYKSFTEGGESLVEQWLPESLRYSPVTLERAMDADSSVRVQKWLGQYIDNWNSYPSKKDGKPMSTQVVITLMDYHLNEVMKWTLLEARPIKWIGPSLSATDSKVAIETLVIGHSGFITDPPTNPSAKVTPMRATLSPGAGATGNAVTFNYNPETLTISHNSSTTSSNNADTSDSNLVDLGTLSLTLPSLTFDGPGTLTCCEQLLDWSFARSAKKGQPNTTTPLLPNLVFSWGTFKVRTVGKIGVTLTNVDITYERFDSKANPTRATVALTLQPVDPGNPRQQNPTSGGLPGRGGHLTVAGETLAGIALDAYGNPADWRVLAAANQIDDPLRLRPGSALYLPSRSELPEGGAP